jgi:ParB-like chromosome segregation protein Spo0J
MHDQATAAPLQVQYRPVAALRSNPRNARSHSKRQIRQLADSIERFGFTNPVLVDDADMILAGHGRVAGAKLLGLEEVPTIRLASLSAAEKRLYVLADNTPAGMRRCWRWSSPSWRDSISTSSSL